MKQTIDIVSVFVFIASLLFSPEIANVVGPYMVIILASTIGASFALARRERSTRLSALGFFLRINGLAILLTVGLAAIAQSWGPALQERVLLAPIALVLGFIGDDLPKVLRWAGGKVNALVDALIKLKSGGGQ